LIIDGGFLSGRWPWQCLYFSPNRRGKARSGWSEQRWFRHRQRDPEAAAEAHGEAAGWTQSAPAESKSAESSSPESGSMWCVMKSGSANAPAGVICTGSSNCTWARISSG
jgi:hypothetical protein